MTDSTLIIGGCRSGKSSYALALAQSRQPSNKFFVATCVPRDPEMEARVARHRTERDASWQVEEIPLHLHEFLLEQKADTDLILIDCLTLWISNLMMAHDNDSDILASIDRLCDRLCAPPCPVLLVTNEVGAGIVPENDLARRYRDLVGHANQQVAAVCRQVIWMVAGIAVPIKPSQQAPC
ncbi:MAG: bifunctional adenosylcobinamide kinase/adenosylcobinamide-phosphate guanylyltransferase [Desulfatitalea sp.]|nr:bifunctional adenosylcobinamide kinase/adenosylcobinamide-phosphate guanylyltransferase [Desulfatitalea sp.]NNK01082.1 bifunctional adenosylcobinamide kinase/adenosylcobinamide-phosphate guanylyltransferase [Desulfatitalea sp.]